MLRRIKNRKRSTSRTPAQNRNTSGRKVRVEKLAERKLMAADFGGFGDFYGPQLPMANPVAAQFGSVDPTQGRLNNRTSLEISTQGVGVRFELDRFHRLMVTGTQGHDVVNLDYNAETGRIDIFAESFNNAGQVSGRVTGSVLYDDVESVNANLLGGHDVLNANVFYRPVTADGGSGNDTLRGSYGPNTLKGGSGRDTLKGSVNNDVLDGGDHNDRIEGGPGVDTIRGGDGRDTLIGGNGNDWIYGGDGFDNIFGDHMFGGESDSDGGDHIWGGRGNDSIRGGGGNDVIDGGDDADFIFGGSGLNTLSGGKGGDFISGGDDFDLISGGDDGDTIYGNGGDDTILGGGGSDHIHGGDGDDTLYGQGGADYRYGDGDEDYLDGGNGSRDHLFGGLGRDLFVRHKHVWTSDDPDVFEDIQNYENVINKWFYDI